MGAEVGTKVMEVLSSILLIVLPLVIKKREPSELEEKYAQLRLDVAKALTLYACYYKNPVDLARLPDQKLPPAYENARTELRKLASEASALAVILESDCKSPPFTKEEMTEVSNNLIGLSNSMNTPYNCGVSREDLDDAREYEARIRALLNIKKQETEEAEA